MKNEKGSSKKSIPLSRMPPAMYSSTSRCSVTQNAINDSTKCRLRWSKRTLSHELPRCLEITERFRAGSANQEPALHNAIELNSTIGTPCPEAIGEQDWGTLRNVRISILDTRLFAVETEADFSTEGARNGQRPP